MSIAVSNVSQSQPVPPATRNSTLKPAQKQPEPANDNDTVTLSPAAQAKIDALKEAQAPPPQNDNHVKSGDIARLKLNSPPQ